MHADYQDITKVMVFGGILSVSGKAAGLHLKLS
jgi:hypothetical protein